VHDGNGNLTADGQGRSMSWSTEDRLKEITDSNPAAGSGGRSCEFVYDAMGRRIRSIYSTGTGPAKAEHHSTLYLYDRWDVIAEYESLPNASATLHTSHTWGLDLSNTPQGAGGIGGLLATKQHTTTPVVLYHAYDGNGNITQATDTNDQIRPTFRYDTFGRITQALGDQAGNVSYRFSTKPAETWTSTGWLYFGYRWYVPETGRWLSRDPIEERGGINLYSFVRNNPVGKVDVLGREEFDPLKEKLKNASDPQSMRKNYPGTGFGKVGNADYLLTCHCGIIDLRHFFAALDAAQKGEKAEDYMTRRFDEENALAKSEQNDIHRGGLANQEANGTLPGGNHPTTDDLPSEALGHLAGQSPEWKVGVLNVIQKCHPVDAAIRDQYVKDHAPPFSGLGAIAWANNGGHWMWSVPYIVANDINAAAKKIYKPYCCPKFDSSAKPTVVQSMNDYLNQAGLSGLPHGFPGPPVPPGTINHAK
jgi:RHS repeat-associated protein